DKTVPRRVFRAGNTQHFPVKDRDDISHGKGRADMADVRPSGLIQNNPADLGARDLDLRGQRHRFHSSNRDINTPRAPDCKDWQTSADGYIWPAIMLLGLMWPEARSLCRVSVR